MNSDQFGNWDSVRYRAGGSSVAWNESGGEIVVLDLDRSVYFGLNASAAVLWKCLMVGASRHELVTATMVLGVDATRAADDVDQYLAALEHYGLLHAA